MGQIIGARAGAKIFNKPEPRKNGPAPLIVITEMSVPVIVSARIGIKGGFLARSRSIFVLAQAPAPAPTMMP
jgi:hypothetical protein